MKKIHVIVLGALVVIASVWGVCHIYVKQSVRIVNKADCDLMEMSLYLSNRLVWTGTVERDTERVIPIDVQRDSSLHVTGTCASRSIDSGPLGYATTGPGDEHVLTYSIKGFSYDRRNKLKISD